MNEPTQKPKDPASLVGLFPALVVALHEGRATVRPLEGLAEIGSVRCAVVGYTPRAGDRVLVQVLADGTAYLTGVLYAREQSSLRTESGASAELDASQQKLCLRDSSGELVCEFDAASGRLLVHTRGSLELAAPAASLEVTAARVGFSADRLELRAKELVAELETASWRAERWELRAARLAERVRDKLVDVEDALQTRAGRVRSLVNQTWELLSQRTRMVSKENTSIDGEKILLG